MIIAKPEVEVLTPLDGDYILKFIERCGRVSYKTEDMITNDSAYRFIENIINRGHESVLEHFNITVVWTCDRGVSHELVRHRIASYTQESTRYCNYSKDKFGNQITVVKPVDIREGTEEYQVWEDACNVAEYQYFNLLEHGVKPQTARAILPTCLKTEVVITMNLREWRHFLKLRCDIHAHPDIRILALKTLNLFSEQIPIVFNGI